MKSFSCHRQYTIVIEFSVTPRAVSPPLSPEKGAKHSGAPTTGSLSLPVSMSHLSPQSMSVRHRVCASEKNMTPGNRSSLASPAVGQSSATSRSLDGAAVSSSFAELSGSSVDDCGELELSDWLGAESVDSLLPPQLVASSAIVANPAISIVSFRSRFSLPVLYVRNFMSGPPKTLIVLNISAFFLCWELRCSASLNCFFRRPQIRGNDFGVI